MSADPIHVNLPPVGYDDGPSREVPELTELTEPFWTSGERGELRILRCGICRRWIHPPSPNCPACHSPEVAYETTSGKGTVFSYTINHRAWRRELLVPYVIAIVELAEQPGLRVATNVIGCKPETVAIDLPVRVCFLAQPPYYIPLFEPDTEEGSE